MKLIILTVITLSAFLAKAEELLPATSESRETAHAYLITSGDSNYSTELHVLNLSAEPLYISATLYDGDGNPLGRANTPLREESIPGLGRLALGAEDLERVLEAPAWRGPAFLKAEGSVEFELMTTLRNPTGLATNTNCVTTESVHHLLPGISYVRLINQGDKAISDIRGTLVQENGEMVGVEERQLIDDLPAKAARFLTANQLLNLFGSWSGLASLHINANESDDLRLLALDWKDRSFVSFTCNQRSNRAPPPVTCSDPRPQACIQSIEPVCAARDTGIRCITTPCDSTEWATYSNGCIACGDSLVIRYVEGSCEALLENGT